MTLTVLLFASYADALGHGSIQVDVPEGATVGELVSHIAALPAGWRLPPKPLVAVNMRYAQTAQVLALGDEVALIPPVAGG